MPRAGLTPEAVVAEAARVADEVGLERVTLVAVADRFGVAVPSLYKHVGGLPALRRELAVLAVRELGDALDEGAAAADPFAGLASAYRDYARSHPGRYAATVRAPEPNDGDAIAATERVLATVQRVLSRYGLTGDDAIDAIRSVRASLHGFVSLEAAGGFGLSRDVDRSFDRLVEMLEASLRAGARRKRQPSPGSAERRIRGG